MAVSSRRSNRALACLVVVAATLACTGAPDERVVVPAATAAPPAYDATGGLRPLLTPTPGRNEADVTWAALDWLARHQSPDGSWDADGFASRCVGDPCPGHGGATNDDWLTGVALLAFLGAGETHQSGTYKATVKRALDRLTSRQDEDGCLAARASERRAWNHVACAVALVEAYGITSSIRLHDPAQRAVDVIGREPERYLPWRCGVRPGDDNAALTAWTVMAIKSAELAELNVDRTLLREARAWLEAAPDIEERDRSFPWFGAAASESMRTATRIWCDEDGARLDEIDTPITRGILRARAHLPQWVPGRSLDFADAQFGTYSSFQVGGAAWRQWKPAMREALWPWQRGDEDCCAKGSWDPADGFGPEGGRVYATAVGALVTEVWFRYERVTPRRR